MKEFGMKKYEPVTVPSIALNDGMKMPVLACGTALIDGKMVSSVVEAAVSLGYRHFDTAAIYGNEVEIGQALQETMHSGEVKREDLFIASKLWSTFHTSELAVQACQGTLDRLGLQYVDLMMIHLPMTFKEGPLGVPTADGVVQPGDGHFMSAWRGLEALAEAGSIRSVGLSNFNARQIDRVIREGTIRPVVNQVECHPYLNQLALDRFCQERDIVLSCYGTLGSAGTPSQHVEVKKVILNEPVVLDMAEKYGKTASQILLQYQLDRAHSVAVKTTSRPRLLENLQALGFNLSKQDIDLLHTLNCEDRHFTFKGMGDTHEEYPFNDPF